MVSLYLFLPILPTTQGRSYHASLAKVHLRCRGTHKIGATQTMPRHLISSLPLLPPWGSGVMVREGNGWSHLFPIFHLYSQLLNIKLNTCHQFGSPTMPWMEKYLCFSSGCEQVECGRCENKYINLSHVIELALTAREVEGRLKAGAHECSMNRSTVEQNES